MRLIDADALISEIYDIDTKYGMGALGDGLEMAKELVLNAPTIEPEKLHGEWIETYYSIDGVGASRFKCSKCENEIRTYGEPYNFCPSCGSPMNEKALEMLWKREGEAE